MELSINNNKGRLIVKSEIIPALKGIEIDYNKSIKKIGIILLSDEKLKDMNIRYLKSDYYTDIISFNYSEDSLVIEGELYISSDRIKDNAKKYEITVKEEMYRVIIHGVLHLAGEEDEKTEQKKHMHNKENQYLKLICFT
jgi:probable rRNA maturation factor